MYRHGHLGTNLLIAAPVVALHIHLQQPLLAVVAALVIPLPSRLPDHDLKISILDHRGFSHTLWAALLFGGLFALALWPLRSFVPGVSTLHVLLIGLGYGSLGYLGHIAADALTPMGVRPFAPVVNTHISLSLCNASDDLANTGLLAAGVFSLCLVVVASYGGLPSLSSLLG